jgi:Tfp pilus assembly protein FimT
MGQTRDTDHSADGFSLIEMQLALVLTAIVAGMAVISVQGALSSARGDTAMIQVASILRTGRDAAVAQRRSIDVRFTDSNRIELVRNDVPNGTTVVSTVVLENGAQFQRNAEIPDTPDGYGASSAIDFDESETIRFQADGILTDASGIPLNGTVFTGLAGQAISSRAVTVTGSSGRAQGYRWTGSRWEAR